MITTAEAMLTDMRQFIDGSAPRVGEADVKRLEDHRKDSAADAGRPTSDLLSDMVAESRRDAAKFEKTSRAHANLGFALLNAHQLEEAAAEFEKALVLDGSSYLAALGLGRTWLLLGQVDKAQSLFSQLAGSHADQAAPLLGLSEIAFRSGQLEECLELVRRAVKLEATSVIPRYHLAIVLLHAGNYSEAISQLRLALREDAKSAWLHHSLGVAYALQKDFRKARRSFEIALNLTPGMNEAIKGLAKVLLEQRAFSAAAELLNEQIHTHPHDPELRELLAWGHIHQKEYRKARSELYKSLSELSAAGQDAELQRWRLSNNLGVCYAYMRETDLAERFFSRSIELLPKAGPLPYNNLARLYLQTQHVEAAHDLAQDTVKLFPDDKDAPILLAFSLMAQDKDGEAIDVLHDALAKDRTRPLTYAVLAALLVDVRADSVSATEIIAEARERFPHDPLVANNYAYVHLVRGEAAPARAALSSIPDSDKLEPSLRVALTATRGLLCLHDNDLRAAAELYKRAARIARESNNLVLSLYVRQKMHLELARAYQRRGEMKLFDHEVRQGLAIKVDRGLYRRQLLALSKSVDRGQELPGDLADPSTPMR